MEAKKEERKSRFFEWLARSVSSAQLSELYQAFINLEAVLSSNKYPHHLAQPLVETEDADAIDRLYRDFKKNKQFMCSNKSGIKLSLLRYYACYCRECQSAATSEQRQEAVSPGDARTQKAKAQDLQFAFSEDKQQWWTRDVSPKSIGEPEAMRPEIVKRNQSAFFEWLRAQGFDTVDLYAIYGIARKIHTMLLEEGVTLGLFGTCEIDRLRAYINAAKRMEVFLKGDKRENRLWTKATYCYLQFAESEKFAIKPSLIEQDSPKPAFVPPVVEKAADPVQFSDEKLAAGLVQEDGFRQWLKQSESDEQADQIVGVIRSAEQFAQRNHMKGIKMLGVEPSTMRSSVRRMSASNAFIKNDLRLYQLFMRAATFLVKYGTSLDSRGDVQPAPSSTPSAAPVAEQTEGNPKEDSALEPSLLALLRGEQLSVLRDALIQKGIRTLEEFKRLNLWVFMNRNGLYSISERQAVYSSLRQSMAVELEAESGARWKIVTLKSEYTGSSPAGALAEYCRAMAGKYPLRFRGLIGQRMARLAVVPLSRMRQDADDFRMDNPEAYISGETDESSALAFARWIGEMCRDGDVPRSINSIAHAEAVALAEDEEEKESSLPEPTQTVAAEPVQTPTAPPVQPNAKAKPSVISPLQRKVEQLVQDADLTGMTLEQLYSRIPGTTMVALKQVRDNSANLVEIEDRLIHKDAFVDWDTAAQKLEEVVGKLLSRNNGYVSAAQLYEYVRADMQMFLNDNDMDDPRKVFDLAQHLFEKEGYHGKRYTFWMKTHISRSKETLTSNLDVIKKFARDHNGFFRYDDLVTYLERVGIRTGNLRGQMQLGIKPIFFYYSDGEIISAESMRIDEEWLTQAGKAFERLFADVGDHVVLRSINPIWYEQLPTLPGYLPWTPLLLQYILQFYGEKLGAKTISSELNQRYNAIHAMLVMPNGEIQTFADAVVAYLIDSDIPERQFEAEELRRRLVDGRLIAGNELIWHMPRAIGSDPRFAWDASGEKVNIRV